MTNQLIKCVIALGMLMLTACQSTDIQKGEELGWARTEAHGPLAKLTIEQSRAYARRAAPYAMLSDHVYCAYLHGARAVAAGECQDQHPVGDGWRFLFDSQQLLSAAEKETGLAFSVYLRMELTDTRRQVVFAFRGTDFTSLPDWRANAHWVLRHLPREDQYQLLHRRAPEFISMAERETRKLVDAPEIDFYSTGHSLGGGLAQYLAYSDKRFVAAVVFDPTPVTAYKTLITNAQVNCNARILRVYETGEVLSYVRSIIRRFYSLSDNIHEVAFNVVHSWGNPVANHSMEKLNEKLKLLGGGTGALAPLPGSPDFQCLDQRVGDRADGVRP